MWAPPVAAGWASLLGVPPLPSELGFTWSCRTMLGWPPGLLERGQSWFPRRFHQALALGLLSWRAEPLGVAGPAPPVPNLAPRHEVRQTWGSPCPIASDQPLEVSQSCSLPCEVQQTTLQGTHENTCVNTNT